MTAGLAAVLRALLGRAEPAVLVEVAAVKGSAPREIGTHMLVTAGATHGTIGGGSLEWEAMLRARSMLEQDEASATMKLPLGPELGQCCGGFVSLRLQRADQALCTELETLEAREREKLPLVLLFGAGHVGKALAWALAPLPVGLIKSTLARGPQPLEELLAQEADGQALLFTSADFAEGRDAFLAKRKPVFTGS